MCNFCQIAREYSGHRFFSPSCLWCGARLIQTLGRLPIGETECRDRRKAVLSDWIGYGHNEQDLRRLARGAAPLMPVPSTESGRLTTRRRR